MLSKVIPANEQLRRVTWRAAAAPSAQLASEPAPPEGREVARLQARLAELATGAEQRAREEREAGFQQGEASARAQAETPVREALEQLAQALVELAEVRARVFQQSESDLVKLSIEVARRILHRELTIDPEAIGALVRAALDRLKGQAVYKVLVHPDHENLVRSLVAQSGTAAPVQVLGDPSREKGSVLFELENGNLDASVETQLREIEHGLADRFGR